jgi:hypothetical protein
MMISSFFPFESKAISIEVEKDSKKLVDEASQPEV